MTIPTKLHPTTLVTWRALRERCLRRDRFRRLGRGDGSVGEGLLRHGRAGAKREGGGEDRENFSD